MLKWMVWILVSIALAIGIGGAVLLSELGQLLNVPRDWVFGYFRIREALSIVAVLATLAVLALHVLRSQMGRWPVIAFSVAMSVCIVVVNWFVPYYWLRSEQHDAVFIPIAEADVLLEDKDEVLVLEIDGDARAYPREWMQLPHFAGHQVGGEDVVMSYCALSDLPLAFSTTFNGETADYRVIAQVHNNLIFTDTVSGELFQQITGRGEYSGRSPESFPVLRMPWDSFMALYPEGLVFYTQPNLLDRFTQLIFDAGLGSHYQGEPLFPTLAMDDDRLPPGEPVWGITLGSEALAVARSAFKVSTRLRVSLNGQPFILVWYPDYEFMAAYYAEINGEPLSSESIDPYGMTDQGQLQRVQLYPGVRWMVWSHWYKNSRLLN